VSRSGRACGERRWLSPPTSMRKPCCLSFGLFGVRGVITLVAIATALNDRKIPTPRGARWHVSSVMNFLARYFWSPARQRGASWLRSTEAWP